MEHQVPLGVPPSSQSPTPRGNHWSDFFSTGLTLITVDKLFYFWTLYINIYVCAQSLHCVQLFATPWTTVCQVPLSMGFSREEYWSGLPFPPPRDLPNPGTEPISPGPPVLPLSYLGSRIYIYIKIYIKTTRYILLYLLLLFSVILSFSYIHVV